MDDMFGGEDSDSEFDFDMNEIDADSAVDELDSDIGLGAEAEDHKNDRTMKEYEVFNARKGKAGIIKAKKDGTDDQTLLEKDNDDDNDSDSPLVVKNMFLKEFDTDEYSIPEELEHLDPTVLRDLKESPISWSRKRKLVEDARVIADATVFSSKEKVWRIAIPLLVAFVVHGLSLLSRRRLKLLVGVLAIMASVVVKIPQIRALEQTNTSKGVSRGIEYCQILSFTISIMNGIRHRQSVLTWGDELFVFGQNIYLISLMWKLSETRMSEVGLTVGFYFVYIIAMAMAIFTLPHEYLWPFQVLEVALLNPGYIPQIYKNHKNEHSGCLSGITQAMSVFMHLAHVYTNLTDGVNVVVGLGYLVSASLNVILLLQIIAYAVNSQAFIERELELARMPQLERKILQALKNNSIETLLSGTSEML